MLVAEGLHTEKQRACAFSKTPSGMQPTTTFGKCQAQFDIEQDGSGLDLRDCSFIDPMQTCQFGHITQRMGQFELHPERLTLLIERQHAKGLTDQHIFDPTVFPYQLVQRLRYRWFSEPARLLPA